MSEDGMAEPEGFAAVDHTADLGLRVWARDLEGLFVQAARGLAAWLTDPATVVARQEAAFEIDGLDLEELLVGWLGEILYRHESEGLLLAAFERPRIERIAQGWRLHALARGERRDPARHPGGEAVKAVTYHDLRIVPREDGGYEATLIFDA